MPERGVFVGLGHCPMVGVGCVAGEVAGGGVAGPEDCRQHGCGGDYPPRRHSIGSLGSGSAAISSGVSSRVMVSPVSASWNVPMMGSDMVRPFGSRTR